MSKMDDSLKIIQSEDDFDLDNENKNDVEYLKFIYNSNNCFLPNLSDKLPNLTTLVLNKSKNLCIRDFGLGFINLKSLSLCDCNLYDLDGISCMPNLVDLQLADNFISDISSLSNLDYLENLNLSGNLIKNFDFIESLSLCQSLLSLMLLRTVVSKLKNYITITFSLLPKLDILDGQPRSILGTEKCLTSFSMLQDASYILDLIVEELEDEQRFEKSIISENQETKPSSSFSYCYDDFSGSELTYGDSAVLAGNAVLAMRQRRNIKNKDISDKDYKPHSNMNLKSPTKSADYTPAPSPFLSRRSHSILTSSRPSTSTTITTSSSRGSSRSNMRSDLSNSTNSRPSTVGSIVEHARNTGRPNSAESGGRNIPLFLKQVTSHVNLNFDEKSDDSGTDPDTDDSESAPPPRKENNYIASSSLSSSSTIKRVNPVPMAKVGRNLGFDLMSSLQAINEWIEQDEEFNPDNDTDYVEIPISNSILGNENVFEECKDDYEQGSSKDFSGSSNIQMSTGFTTYSNTVISTSASAPTLHNSVPLNDLKNHFTISKEFEDVLDSLGWEDEYLRTLESDVLTDIKTLKISPIGIDVENENMEDKEHNYVIGKKSPFKETESKKTSYNSNSGSGNPVRPTKSPMKNKVLLVKQNRSFIDSD